MTTSEAEELNKQFCSLIAALAVDTMLAERALRLHGEHALADRLNRSLYALDQLTQRVES